MDTLIPLVLLEKAYIDRGHLEISMYRLLYVRDILNLFDSYDLVTTTYGKRSTKSSMIDCFFYEDETNVKNITREMILFTDYRQFVESIHVFLFYILILR